MARFKFLILALLFVGNAAFAGYAQLKPPPGWSQGLGAAVPGEAGVFKFADAANGSSWKGTTVLTNAALNVGGQIVTVPASMRVAANGAIAAAEWSFGNPWLFAAALAAPIAYQWFKDAGLEVKNGAWVKMGSAKVWGDYGNPQHATAADACKAATPPDSPPFTYEYASVDISQNTASCFFNRKYNGQPDGQLTRAVYKETTPGGAPGDPPFTPVGLPEFKEIMAPKPMPEGVPKELPDVKWPIEKPVINPQFKPGVNPSPAPSPLNQPSPQPLRVPVGEPQPVPNSDPQKWRQPAVDVTPANTPQKPWQVDLQPKDIEKDTPDGIKEPVTPPVPQPDPVTGETPKDEAKPPETPGLCDEYPDILACQKLDEPESEELEKKDISSVITPDSGWGADNGVCPAPRRLSVAGAEFSFQMICDFSTGIRPVILALAWLSAAFILLGMRGNA